jgi:hypothetical protein
MCFVWISEQTAIMSLYSINWLVCITETECLLRGTDKIFICNFGNSKSLGRTMVQAVSHQPLIANARVRSQAGPCDRYILGKVTQRQDFIQVSGFSSVTVILPMFHTHLHRHATVTKQINGRSLETLQKATVISKSENTGQ